jgi:hypothetical protein
LGVKESDFTTVFQFEIKRWKNPATSLHTCPSPDLHIHPSVSDIATSNGAVGNNHTGQGVLIADAVGQSFPTASHIQLNFPRLERGLSFAKHVTT